ncbi:hypothetical protein Tco_0756503, partial [Tanacetum coccineum]
MLKANRYSRIHHSKSTYMAHIKARKDHILVIDQFYLGLYNFGSGYQSVTPPDGAWAKYVSGGMSTLNISSTKHKERPLR